MWETGAGMSIAGMGTVGVCEQALRFYSRASRGGRGGRVPKTNQEGGFWLSAELLLGKAMKEKKNRAVEDVLA